MKNSPAPDRMQGVAARLFFCAGDCVGFCRARACPCVVRVRVSVAANVFFFRLPVMMLCLQPSCWRPLRSNLGDASVLGSDDGLLRPGSQVLMRPPSGSIEWWEEVLSAERERAEEESTVGSLGSLSSDEGSYEPEEEAGAAVPSDAPSRSSREPCGPMDAATEQETSTSLSRVLSTPQCDDSGTDPATAGEAHPCRVPSLAPTGTDPPSDCDSSQVLWTLHYPAPPGTTTSTIHNHPSPPRDAPTTHDGPAQHDYPKS